MQKLTGNDLQVNKPAKWDCFGANGILLLKKGSVIPNQRQLDELIEHGLFAGQDTVRQAISSPLGKSSPFRDMADIELRLRMIFSSLATARSADLPNRIIKICSDLQGICAMDADAALGMLLLGSESRYTITHPLHVAILCELTAKRKGIAAEPRLSILAAALTSNIAMIELQDTLQKQQSPLTEEQSEKIRLHPKQAADMLREAGVQDEVWINTVQHHHERLNGKGYPGSLSGDDISLPVRIVSLADTYSAMISPRNYRAAKFPHESLIEIFLKRGAEMDESLPHLFIEELGVFPPGSFVNLHNGETAVVVRRGANARAPQVQSVVNPKGVPLSVPLLRDSGLEIYSIREMAPPSKGFAINRQLLWGYKE